MAIFKKRVKSPRVNLDCSMDNRTNNETLNLEDGSNLICSYLENADLFNTYAVQTRNGNIDLSNGIINYTDSNSNLLIDIPEASGDSINYYDFKTNGNFLGFVLICTGDTFLTQGQINILETVAKSVYETGSSIYNSPLYLNTTIIPLNQVWVTGTVMSGTMPITEGFTHNTALNAPNWSSENAYPNMDEWLITKNYNYVAKTDNEITNTFVYDGSTNYVASGTYTFKFDAPIPLYSGQVYQLRLDLRDQASKNSVHPTLIMKRPITIEYILNSGIDIQPYMVQDQEFQVVGGVYPHTYSVGQFPYPNPSPPKPLPVTKLFNYKNPGYFLYDNPAVEVLINHPVVSGNYTTGGMTYYQYYINTNLLPPTLGVPDFNEPAGNTTSTWLGQLIPLSFSGTKTIYGGYHYASLDRDPTNYGSSLATLICPVDYYNKISGTNNKTVGYEAGLFKINSNAGSIVSGTYNASATQVASFSGTINFNDRNTSNVKRTSSSLSNNLAPAVISPGLPNYHLDKIYSIFDNPAVITSGNYIYAVKYFDGTGEPYRDYNYKRTTIGPGYPSDILSGFNLTDKSGGFLVNWNGDNKTFINPDNIYEGKHNTDFACGIIELPSGNAITLLYDYRVGSSLNQKIIVGQRDKLYYTYYVNPDKSTFVTIHSGATVGNNNLWSALTNNDLLFAHHYGVDNGQVWESNYSGVSYDHGKRPTCVVSGTGTGGTFLSGTYSVLLATSLQSGGFRASAPITGISISSGNSIHISGLNMQSQFPFDLNTDSTYIFITEPSGNNYYLANILDSIGGTGISQPIANNLIDCYIDTPPDSVNDLNVPGALDPAYPQRYLTSQIDTPKFKKILNFYNYIIGIGDDNNPSTLFHSEILGPQIWGRAGDYHGSYDVEPSNGQQITGAELFGQYTILYKKNSTFRVEFQGDGGIPFSIQQISPNIGNIGIFTTVSTPEGIFGLSQYGPTLCNGVGVEVIGKEILPWFKEINHDDLTYAFVIHDQTNNVITWSIGNDDNNTDRQYSLILNYKEKTWNIRRGSSWNCAGIIRDSDGFDEIWMGDSLGAIKQDNIGNEDQDIVFSDGSNGTTYKNISLLIETPWMSFKEYSAVQKQFRFLNLNVEKSQSKIRVDVYFDNATTPLYSRIMDLESDSPNKRINLGSRGKTVKFVISTYGVPDKVKINSLMIEYQPIGEQRASQ